MEDNTENRTRTDTEINSLLQFDRATVWKRDDGFQFFFLLCWRAVSPANVLPLTPLWLPQQPKQMFGLDSTLRSDH